MNDKIKEAFDQIHAEETVKANTWKYVSAQMTKAQNRKINVTSISHLRRWSAAAIAACMLCVLLAGGYHLYFTPTAFISIDVNPSMEMEVNRFNRVLGVEGYNKEGKVIAESLDVKNMRYEDALEEILENEEVEAYLSENNSDLSLTLAGENEKQCRSIQQNMQRCADRHENVSCHSSNLKQREHAHNAGLSFGKYQAYQVLKDLDPSVTLDEAKSMTMYEIRSRIAELSGNQNVQNHGYGHGGHGYGYGHGHHGE